MRRLRVAGALAYAEQGKARALVDVLRNGRPISSRQRACGAERARQTEFAAQLGGQSRIPRPAGARAGRSALLTRLRKARLHYEAFLDAVFAAYPQLRKERGDVLSARARDASLLLARGAAGLRALHMP